MENTQTERVDKIAARILHNLEQMEPEERPAYMQKLLGFFDWHQLTLLEFAADMTQEQPEQIKSQGPEARLWDWDKRDGGPTSYFIVITDGDQDIAFELIHDAKEKSFKADPYSPQDYDYTIHDFCDHENDECICESEEFQEQAWRDTKLSLAIQKLRKAEKQLQQTKLANEIAEMNRLDERERQRKVGQLALDWHKLYHWAGAQPTGTVLGKSHTNALDPLNKYLGEATNTRPEVWSVGPSIKTGYGDKLQKPEWVRRLIEETDRATGNQSGLVTREMYLAALERVKP